MPRGIAILELKETLFDAAERVIVEAGVGALTGRAVTGRAGVATGLLNTHFRTFDNFLESYATNRAFRSAGDVVFLRTASGEVAADVTRALLATPLPVVLGVTRLLAARPDVASRVREVLGPEPIRTELSGYLLARDRPDVSLVLAGLLTHVVLFVGVGPEAEQALREGVAAILRP